VFFVTAALLVFVERIGARRWLGPLALAAALLGLATLTRAVLLLFPLGLVVYLFVAFSWREALKRALWLLLVYGVVVSTWTVYNLARWQRLVVGGEGLAAFLYIGSTGWDGAINVDERLAEAVGSDTILNADEARRQAAYTSAAASTIRGDPLGYLRYRVGELASAYLQPHGTTFFPGESLREVGLNWLRNDRTPGGLLALTRGDAFWPKLVIYVFHYVGLIGGLVGMWLYRRQWRLTLPLIGFIAYTTLLHLALLATPRYIFPTEVLWWVFAGAALARVFVRERVRATPFPNPLPEFKAGESQDSSRTSSAHSRGRI
jgi:hypothetical protein